VTTLLLRPQANPVREAPIVEDCRLRNDIEVAIVDTGHRCLRHVSVCPGPRRHASGAGAQLLPEATRSDRCPAAPAGP